jgi:hypothetical protein
MELRGTGDGDGEQRDLGEAASGLILPDLRSAPVLVALHANVLPQRIV